MDRYNAERYYDPTAAEALMNVAEEDKANLKQYRPLVYICSPYAGNIDYNVSRAQGYCRFAVCKGFIPLAPHLHYPQFLDDSDRDQRELGFLFALALLRKCEEVWVFGSRISVGMVREICEAKHKNILVRYFTEKCEEVQVI